MEIAHNPTDGVVLGKISSRARHAFTHRGSRWQGLVSIGTVLMALCVAPSRGNIVPTEIMYHPAGATDANEFVELFNSADQPFALGGCTFDRGITYTFPAGAAIPARSYVVVARSPQILQQNTGNIGILGPFTGALSNQGETIRLLDAAGATLFSIKYGTRGDWPAAADGTGHSLVFPDPNGDPNLARAWTYSLAFGGSPGAEDSPAVSGGQTLNLVKKGSAGSYFKGVREPSNGTTAWTQLRFVTDANWLTGPSGYGYSESALELEPVSTILSDMRGKYISLYVRIPFQISQAQIDGLLGLALTVSYDDGFVAYLNGVRVAATGVNGNPPAYNQLSIAGAEYDPVTFDLASFAHLLVSGQNVLALQGHNVGLGNSSDFVLAPVLTATSNPVPVAQSLRRQLVVNEVLAGHASASNFVEFFNPSEAELDLSSVWLSNDAAELMKYRIPDGTKIASRGFLKVECSAASTGFVLNDLGEAIFLTEPDGRSVAAAYAWGPQLPDVGIGRFPDGGPDWYYQAQATPGGANGCERVRDIVINELMYHDPNAGNAEYIEVFNGGAAPADLSDWKFLGVEFEFPGGTLLAPQSYLVVADDVDVFQARYTTDGLVLGNYGAGLSNAGERLRLLNADDIVIDTVAYEDRYPWPVTPDGLGASLERGCALPDFDDPNQWVASSLTHPSPGAVNGVTSCLPPAASPVVISEFFYHPATSTEDERSLEFIEICNTSDNAVDIGGWALVGDVLYAFPSPTTIDAHGGVVVAWSPSHVKQAYALQGTVYGPYTPGLPNGGGEIQLVNAIGRLADRVSYDDDFPWPSLADGFAAAGSVGYSLVRLCPNQSGSLPENWVAASTPTPGAALGLKACDLPALVTTVGTLPATVKSSDSPVVTATLSNTSSVQSVEIEYWVDDPQMTDEPRLQKTMNDSGTAGDVTANDHVWSATLLPCAANSIVRYRILMRRTGGVEVASPSLSRDAFESHAYFVDPQVTTALPGGTYHLFISAENWRSLQNWTAPGRVTGSQPNPNWDREVPALFVADGVVHDVEVRYQGSRWNRTGGSNIGFTGPSYSTNGQVKVVSWRIQFPSYRNHDGIDVLILQKPGQSGWPQRVSFKMFELAGVPAPMTSWAKFRINGCDYNNTAYQIEHPGADMIARWFGEVGDMFKSQGFTGDEGPWSWGDERLITGTLNGFTAQQRYEYTYDRATRKWAGDPDDGKPDLVQTLIEDLHQARARGPAYLRQWLGETFDVDRTLRYICTINYVGTFDDMFQNHYLYRKVDDGKWCVFPWDMDNTLGGSQGEWNANPFRGADQARVDASPELKARIGNIGNRSGWWNYVKDSFFIAYEAEFLQMFYTLNNTVFEPESLRLYVQAIAAEGGRSQSQINNLMNHITNRHNYLNGFIQPLLPPGTATTQLSESDLP